MSNTINKRSSAEMVADATTNVKIQKRQAQHNPVSPAV
jgi:hypothetical protein